MNSFSVGGPVIAVGTTDISGGSRGGDRRSDARLQSGRRQRRKEGKMMAKKKPSFEEALLRLKEITETLERGDVTLEESIKLFGEGTELSRLCYETLQTAEQKITELSELGEAEESK